ncbi:MAG: hypothetical protein DHS80DRAFT_31463 [Piptocephalis tieghemiana]|nr:MAG: hypothetical protein DHS80DRAFT_31463 [Piptocephalis tieghemiana]
MTPRRRRPVRREPLLTQLVNMPLDYLTYVQEDWISLDWADFQRWVSVYSPVQVGIMSVMDEKTVYYLLPLVMGLSLQMILMSRGFGQQKRDREMVFGQVMEEYNAVYVHPRLQCRKYEVATQTDGGRGGGGSCERYLSPYA